jgi:hypothetical protein
MAIKRYDGNKSRQDGTAILHLTDAQGVTRDVKKGMSVELTQEQIDILGTRYLLSDTSDPVPTAPASPVLLVASDIFDSSGKIKASLLPAGSGGGAGDADRSTSKGVVVWDGTGSQPARPTGYASVEWIQPVDPSGVMENGDTWTPTGAPS